MDMQLPPETGPAASPARAADLLRVPRPPPCRASPRSPASSPSTSRAASAQICRSPAAASVLKRLTSKNKKAAAAVSTRGRKQPAAAGSGVLRLLLSKILHGKAAASKRKPAALQCSESFKRVAAVAPSPEHLEAVKLRANAAAVPDAEAVAAAADHEPTPATRTRAKDRLPVGEKKKKPDRWAPA